MLTRTFKTMNAKLFLLLFVTLTCLSCQNDEFDTQGYWVGAFMVFYSKDHPSKAPSLTKKDGTYYTDTLRLNEMLFFNNDTLIFTRFNETFYQGFIEREYHFDLAKDSITIMHEEEEIPISYSYGHGNLLAIDLKSSEYGPKLLDHFIRVEEYKMADKKQEINSFLTNNPITIGGRTDKIELMPPHWHHMGVLIQDSLEANYVSGNNWYLHSLEKELFLVIGNQLIHVSDFNYQKLVGYTYSPKISEIEILKSGYEQKFKTDDLIGNWSVLEHTTKDGVGQIQKIAIGRDTIIAAGKEFLDTLQWESNNYENKLFIDEDHYERHGNYWKIERLSNDQLVLKRKKNNGFLPEIEVIILKRGQ